MALDSIRLSATIPASPDRVYAAWLNAAEHSKMTGGKATFDPKVGGKHSAWDGYITGKNITLETNKRIVQTWRASDFPKAAGDSRVEVLFELTKKGETLLTIIHTELALGLGVYFTRGWNEFYFKPMKAHFKKVAAKPAKKVAAKPAKKVAAKPAKKVAAKPAKKVAAKPAKKVAAKPAKKVAAKPAKKAKR
jgi:activator of HSP90 ATPase